MNVLLLEPTTGMRVMMRGVLRDMEINNLHEPKSSLQALHILIHEKIDFFICSNKVSPITAMMCLKMIRHAQEERIRHVRTIISVDDYDEVKLKKMQDFGCDHILYKPFSADDITSLIKRLIRKRAGFVECKAYIGPDRRTEKGVDYPHFERRNPDFNPGRVDFKHKLSKLVQIYFDVQAKKLEEETSEKAEGLRSKGIIMDDPKVKMVELKADKLKPGMKLQKNARTDSGMMVLPAHSILDLKTLLSLRDLVAAGRLEDNFLVSLQ